MPHCEKALSKRIAYILHAPVDEPAGRGVKIYMEKFSDVDIILPEGKLPPFPQSLDDVNTDYMSSVYRPLVEPLLLDTIKKTKTLNYGAICTASFGDVPGYRVGGKTGTADKAKATGGYYEDKVIATFASVFPTDEPQYVLVVTLDEPVETSGKEPRRTAGWTAVPVAAEVIRRAAPLLGLAPGVEPSPRAGVTLARN